MLAKREFNGEYFREWNTKYEKIFNGNADEEEKDKLFEKLNEEMEINLTLVGSTAIEDKLQDKCKDTIIAARKAGIKLWVLTGDKVETAMMIG